jgi:hypothetical protein
MRRFAPTLSLLLAGCSTAPLADFLDIVKPAPKCQPPESVAAPALPSFPAGPVSPPVTTAPPAPPPAQSSPPTPSWPAP